MLNSVLPDCNDSKQGILRPEKHYLRRFIFAHRQDFLFDPLKTAIPDGCPGTADEHLPLPLDPSMRCQRLAFFRNADVQFSRAISPG